MALAGMLYKFRRGDSGPLVGGTLGFCTLLYLMSQHQVRPSWPAVAGFLGLTLVPAVVGMALERFSKRR